MEGRKRMKAGYLIKQGGRRKNWKQRFFVFYAAVMDPMDHKRVVQPAQIKYYVSSDTNKKPAGSFIPALHTSVVEEVTLPPFGAARYGFSVTVGERTYYLIASTDTDRHEWIQLILDAQPMTPPTLEDEEHIEKAPLDLSNVRNRQEYNSIGEPIPVSHICRGYLRKEGKKVKNWKRRWFHLRDTYIYYYRDRGIHNPLGQIDLDECTGVGFRDDPGLEFGFDIVTSDRTYLLQADTEHDREMWVNSVAAVLANRDIRRTPSSRGAQEVRTLSEALDDITYNHRTGVADGVDTPSDRQSLASDRKRLASAAVFS
eukprot:TRINITY_DN9461_c0_g1_i2.p1 TRINITY_DN9461_c0_g1~~TRINITY_DN9461_c0_g1_i2.p1  ORF type:complete len:314 (+),score=51.19 TRINITY_DN9461_c0_g1_i2:126-1067(+)